MTSLCERVPKCAVLFSLSILFSAGNAWAQAAPETSKEKPAAVPQEKPAEPPNAAQIELLETKYRFETNGDSRKEVHALVRINSELGVRQFARLNFDYNRSFQSVEIPLVHITHASGGTADILPRAITDAPNPAVEKFPAYHDVRVKSVRILGLQPGDSLEYRVITTTTHHPLAPDFWMSHSFDRTGVVTTENFELSVPQERPIQLRVNPKTPAIQSPTVDATRTIYRWEIKTPAGDQSKEDGDNPPMEDVALTSFASWEEFAGKLWMLLQLSGSSSKVIDSKVAAFWPESSDTATQVKAIYDFVSKEIRTIDLPLGSTGFKTREPEAILTSGYGTPEDKYRLFAALCSDQVIPDLILIPGDAGRSSADLPLPSIFQHALGLARLPMDHTFKDRWLDMSVEVAPFGVVRSQLRGRKGLTANTNRGSIWTSVAQELPFGSKQSVLVNSNLDRGGKLYAKVKYLLRGDNELLLRVAFHQAPPEKQKEIAQYLALSDGFRGKVTNVKTSDPYDTDKPFEVEYELTQEKFVDWSKQPVRVPALLPLPGLPEASKKQLGDTKIDLGPPLNIELSGTLRLPAGTTAQAPAGTSVKRDYATFSSEYSSQANLLHFSRHLNFLSSELPAERSLDLNAFLHALQNDQSQLFVLDKPDSVPPAKPK